MFVFKIKGNIQYVENIYSIYEGMVSYLLYIVENVYDHEDFLFLLIAFDIKITEYCCGND